MLSFGQVISLKCFDLGTVASDKSFDFFAGNSIHHDRRQLSFLIQPVLRDSEAGQERPQSTPALYSPPPRNFVGNLKYDDTTIFNDANKLGDIAQNHRLARQMLQDENCEDEIEVLVGKRKLLGRACDEFALRPVGVVLFRETN